ncbi:UNVERIFIED_ORG: hypothetical protein JN05_01262 [Zoogloea ramigera]|uniref:Uncharacterized protein n=1 Tax=Duganella zoogloeoides TaxID=75659 RepID=A0ABZ0Y495_9BURK|nr:hypothetical protein [Duganella zoogloeoides]WQH06868.1 hypothetical protein SR858_11220 [Duganella zoogloeoides]
MGARQTLLANPLDLLAAKQVVGQEDADATALVVLIALDAAKRGLAPASLANTLTEHLLTSAAVWSQQGNRRLYDKAVLAWAALLKACARPTALLDLTTGEYAAIRLSIAYYVRALPKLEVGVLAVAHEKALRQLRD